MLSGKTASSGRQVGWHRGGGANSKDFWTTWENGGVVGTTPSVVPQLSRESCPGGQGWLTWQCPHIGLLKLHGVSVTLVTLLLRLFTTTRQQAWCSPIGSVASQTPFPICQFAVASQLPACPT